MNLGIIPAAGKAERWGGMMKELMPLSTGKALIDHSIEALSPACDSILIVTSMEKLQPIAAHIGKWNATIPIWLVIQQYPGDIWGAIRSTFDWPADRYFFSMPDTVYNKNAFAHYPTYDFTMGVFETDMPERFGVVTRADGLTTMRPGIINKKPAEEWKTAPPYKAWGVLIWTRKCVEFWNGIIQNSLYQGGMSYTSMFNKAIREYGMSHWPLEYYYDFASHADYLAYFKDRLVIEATGNVGLDTKQPTAQLNIAEGAGKWEFPLDGRKRP